MNASAMQHIFVYGTLKRGQCRDSQWPCSPLAVRNAYVFGELYDLGTYPAMLLGSDRIAGEVWSFANKDVSSTLKVLDEIEDYRNAPSDLYTRVTVDCWLLKLEESISAMTYRYAHPSHLAPSMRVEADANSNMCEWPRATV